jgi:hypothetical protein
MSLKNDLVSGGKSYTVLESTHKLCGHCMYQFLNITDVFWFPVAVLLYPSTVYLSSSIWHYTLKHLVRPPGTNGQKPPTEAGFPVLTSGTAGYGKTKTKMKRPRTLWALKEQVLTPKPWLRSRWWWWWISGTKTVEVRCLGCYTTLWFLQLASTARIVTSWGCKRLGMHSGWAKKGAYGET